MTSWLQKLGLGLKKSSSRLSSGISDIFTKRKIDDATLEELEELLITSDMGVKASSKIVDSLSRVRVDKSGEPEEIRTRITDVVSNILKPCEKDFAIEGSPCVILMVGVNGAGKTTLIKLLTKRLEPDSGFVRIGKNLQEAYFDQNRLTLDPKKTLWQTLCDKGDHILVHGQYRHVVAYLKDFLFKPDQAHCPVAALSGGEKNRLMLAVALAQPSNFLVLDEPTNDLDMDTLDLLQEVLDDYQGTILIVSHDRDFLDRVVTSVIYMKGDGTVSEHAGSYSELLEKIKGQQENAAAAKPTAKKADKNKEDKPSAAKPAGNSRKLSYKQQRLLEVLPQEVAKLEEEIAAIEAELGDSSLYTENPEKFDRLTKDLCAKHEEKDD